jgi:hypothetical protein
MLFMGGISMEGLRNRQEPQHADNTALYFPHIAVPKTPWFTQVLLYWDKAATIVPRGSSMNTTA